MPTSNRLASCKPEAPLFRLLKYGRRYRSEILQATGCSIVNTLMDLAPPALMGAAIDVLLKQQDSFLSRFGIQSVPQQFFLLAFLMLPMPFILIGSLRYQKLLEPRYDRVREQVGDLNTRLENNISGITTIKSFTAEDYERERLKNSGRHSKQFNRIISTS